MKGSCKKRGENSWRIRLSLGTENGRRLYHTETFVGAGKDAHERMRILLRQYDTGVVVQPTEQSLYAYLLEWWNTHRGDLAPRTASDYREIIERYYTADPKVIKARGLTALGRCPLDKVTPLAIQQHVNELRTKLAPSSLRKVFIVLKTALKAAVGWRLLHVNPADAVKLPATARKRSVKALNPAQVQAFLAAAAAGSPRLVALWLVALSSGMRPEEYLALGWEHVDFQARTVRVERTLYRPRDVPGFGKPWAFEPTKTEQSRRTIHLPEEVMAELAQHRARQHEDRLKAGEVWQRNELVFCDEIGRPLHHQNLSQRHFKRLLKAADLPSTFNLYSLRHACATMLLLAGESPKVVAERLGHSSVVLTLDVYSAVLPTMQEAAATKLGSMMFGGHGHLRAVK